MKLRQIKDNFLQIGSVDGLGSFVYFPQESKIVLIVNQQQKTSLSFSESVSTLQSNITASALQSQSHPYRAGLLVSVIAIIAACAIGDKLQRSSVFSYLSYFLFLLLSFLSGVELGLIWKNWLTDRIRNQMETIDGSNLVEVDKMSRRVKFKLIKKQIGDLLTTLFITLLVILFFQLLDIWHMSPDTYITLLPPNIPNALFTVYAAFILTIAWAKSPLVKKIKCIKALKKMQILPPN